MFGVGVPVIADRLELLKERTRGTGPEQVDEGGGEEAFEYVVY